MRTTRAAPAGRPRRGHTSTYNILVEAMYGVHRAIAYARSSIRTQPFVCPKLGYTWPACGARDVSAGDYWGLRRAALSCLRPGSERGNRPRGSRAARPPWESPSAGAEFDLVAHVN